MTGRVRNWSTSTTLTGSAVSKGIVTTLSYPVGRTSTCTDYVNQWDTDNVFLVDKTVRRVEVVEGDIWNTLGSTWWGSYTHLPVLGIGGYNPPSPANQFAVPDFESQKLLWLGAMVPGSPGFNLPAFVGELKDLPDLLFQLPDLLYRWGTHRFGKNVSRAAKAADIARRAIGDVGSLWLGHQFGLRPMEMDALAMLGLLDELIHMLELLLRLMQGREVKRSLRLPPRREVIADGVITTQSWPKTLRHNRVRVYNERSWVTSRWAPLIPMRFVIPSAKEALKIARRLVLGLSPGGIVDAWWELLPWSWLVDWFFKVQQLLKLMTGNQLILRCVSMCYCRTCTLDVYWSAVKPLPKGHVLVGSSFHQRVTKQRYPLLGLPADQFKLEPRLTPSRAGILAALGAQYGASSIPIPRGRRLR